MDQQIPLAYYWTAVKRRWLLIVIVALLAGLIGYGIASRSQPRFEVHFSYIVSLAEREQAPEYRFDGYYALQATDLFTTTLAGWIVAPEVGVAAYQEAGILVPADPRTLSRVISAEKAAPQLVRVTVRGDSEQEATSLAAGLRDVMAANVEKYHDQGTPELAFSAVSTDPWTGIVKPIEMLVAAATAVFVLVAGLNVAVFLAAVRAEKT